MYKGFHDLGRALMSDPRAQLYWGEVVSPVPHEVSQFIRKHQPPIERFFFAASGRPLAAPAATYFFELVRALSHSLEVEAGEALDGLLDGGRSAILGEPAESSSQAE